MSLEATRSASRLLGPVQPPEVCSSMILDQTLRVGELVRLLAYLLDEQ